MVLGAPVVALAGMKSFGVLVLIVAERRLRVDYAVVPSDLLVAATSDKHGSSWLELDLVFAVVVVIFAEQAAWLVVVKIVEAAVVLAVVIFAVAVVVDELSFAVAVVVIAVEVVVIAVVDELSFAVVVVFAVAKIGIVHVAVLLVQ